MRHSLARDLPALSPEQDLAVYRVAQESLTNVARHAQRERASSSSSEEDGARRPARLRRRLRHRGAARRATVGGVGGMRERALLAGGRLHVRALPERGTEVRLDLWPSP